MIFSTLITILAASSVSGYSLCNTANYPYAGKTISIPILKSSTSKGANGETVTVSGTVNIVDGCKVTIANSVSFLTDELTILVQSLVYP